MVDAMDSEDEGLPPKEWSKGDKRFLAFLIVALLLFLGAVAVLALAVKALA